MKDALLLPAFSDPVVHAQQSFRLALRAMSEPGAIQAVEHAPALDALAPATYALCLSLLDSDTPVWLAPAFDTPGLRANLAFHCGCPVVGERGAAAFALLTADEFGEPGGLGEFRQGSDRDPELSCTLLVQLPGLEEGAPLSWQGPGIRQERVLRLPLPQAFWQERKDACGFPKGLDIFFTSGQRLLALPRSTRVLHTMQEVV
ncbi:phosphonate C-P lyase system protein PhnH [Pollutimonas bauzanensis]|uniref:Alpha-D-ribose 1-methylphosphonate 5-triphosphate synthase subunit PhnH n=1 Tax=Pollutimonas bauzanensis TaxID=658167 RepID=A0A1M5MEU3_9BURK|nr:phosphonate C-P lyase system protein PhnH [Pollutimonas bauzanensis]SHG75233.1 alpha-D-ribose 1-methylphosphonate 5-triphosphate synthase subunit PhnH [Pollutimonas bauzanensis]